MKTKLFLLVGCFFTALTLNAQNVEDFEENANATAAADVVYVNTSAWIDDSKVYVSVDISEPISCAVRVKGEVRWKSGNKVDGNSFFIRLEAGETYKTVCIGDASSQSQITEIRGEETDPYSCDDKTIIYNL